MNIDLDDSTPPSWCLDSDKAEMTVGQLRELLALAREGEKARSRKCGTCSFYKPFHSNPRLMCEREHCPSNGNWGCDDYVALVCADWEKKV